MLVSNNLRYDDCPLCKSSSIFKIGKISYSSPIYFSSNEILLTLEPELWKCRSCKSGFAQNVIPEEKAAFLYQIGAAEERWDIVPFEQAKTDLVVKTLNQFLVPHQSVLDIGCNTGEFLDFAKNKGCKTAGVEYSSSSLKVLQEKQHNVFQNMNEVTDQYNIITAFDVVEHLYNLSSFIKRCVEKLTAGGRLIFLTGDIASISARLASSRWWYSGFPEHVIFPSKAYFKRCPNLQLEGWYPTYAAAHYQFPIFKSFRSVIKKIKNSEYTGYPSLSCDHVLIVLKKVQQH